MKGIKRTVTKYYKTVYSDSPVRLTTPGTQNGNYGWTIYPQTGYGDVYKMLSGDAVSTAYPRWQHSSPNVYAYIKFPQKCIITLYITTQWCDGSETGRICNHWIIRGYESEEDMLALRNASVIDDNTWASISKGQQKSVTLQNNTPFQYYTIQMVSNFAGSGYCSMGNTFFYARLPYQTETTGQEAEFSRDVPVYEVVKETDKYYSVV